MAYNYLVPINSVLTSNIMLVGGKGNNLGRLMKLGYPVPKGFIVTTHAYRQFIIQNQLDKFIQEKLIKFPNSPSNDNEKISQLVSEIFLGSEFPGDIHNELAELISDLAVNSFAVRSSAIVEDNPNLSFAGLFESYLNVTEEFLESKIKHCWLSLFSDRSIIYRNQHGLKELDTDMAVIVQQMVISDFSGIMFTADPVGLSSAIVVEITEGLGDRLVSGQIIPSRYYLDREHFNVLKSNKPLHKISNDLLQLIGRIGAQIEFDFGVPQDIEFAIQDGKLFIVQTRPITTL